MNDALEGCEGVTVYGIPGTEAEAFANRNRIPFMDSTTLIENE